MFFVAHQLTSTAFLANRALQTLFPITLPRSRYLEHISVKQRKIPRRKNFSSGYLLSML